MIIQTLASPTKPFNLILILLMTIQSAVTVDGWLSIPLTSVCQDILISDDGSMLLCPFYNTDSLNIYRNTGSGFELQQTIQLVAIAQDTKLRGQNRLYLSFYFSIRIYENINGSYQETYSLLLLSPIYIIDVSEDEEILVASYFDGRVEVYHKNGSIFTLHQTLTDASNSILYVDLSTNGQKLATFEMSTNFTRIYENNSGMFILKQMLSIPFRAYEIFLEESLMEIHGLSPLILVFELAGGAFTLAQTITTNETVIFEMKMEGDMSKFAFGGIS